MRIASVGDLMWYVQRSLKDIPNRNRTAVVWSHNAILGGSAVNIGEHLSRGGANVKLISPVSANDRRKTAEALKKRNLSPSSLIPYEGNPNFLVAFADKKAARSIFLAHPAHPEAYREAERELTKCQACVYGGSRDPEFQDAVLRHAKRRANVFVFAPSYSIFHHAPRQMTSFARCADICIMNEEEFKWFARSLGGKQTAIAKTRTCIVTQASKGALVYAAGRRARVESTSGRGEDVIGAGDAFLAAFIRTWLGTARRDPFLASEAAAVAAGAYVRRQSR